MYRLLILLFAMSLAGCGGEEQSTANTTEAGEPTKDHTALKDASISWYDGTIEEAFSVAKAENMPLFFYWGAVWCPPCQEIKYTVFKTQEFINLTKLFVPVYLDGDTERAQAWGEKFGVAGYPTMIVFNPSGEEVTRIPGGIDISKYNAVLELSLNQMRPTSTLIEYALGDTDKLQQSDYEQLAYYSWGQDATAVPEGTDKAALFYKLSELAPAGELSARFYMWYLVSVVQKNKPDEEGADPVLPLAEGDDVYAKMSDILASTELTLACWDSIAYYADDVLVLPVFTEEQKSDLESIWVDKVFSLRFDESLSKAEKLAGWLPRLYSLTRDDQDMPPEVQEELKAEMQLTDAATPDSFERQSVINQMSYIFRNAKMNAAAKELLLAELDKSAAPYYFMSGLSAMAEKEEDIAGAIEWRRKAYESSTGEATRFQWGANYVRTLVRLAPEDTEAITNQSIALLAEFHATNEMFAGRNFKILRRLNKQLLAWQESQAVTEFAFKSKVESLCDTQEAGSLEESNCRSLFTEETVAQAS